MAVHLKDGRIHVQDANGVPYVGAKLYVYNAATTALQPIWTDSALNVSAANPLTSDSAGYFALTYLTSGTYKLRIEQSDGTLIVELDNQDTGIPLGSGVLGVPNGGTGGETAAAARTNLDVPANSEITTITSDVLARLKKTGGELTGDTDNSGTGFFAIPSGTTAQQATPSNGTGIRFNTTTSQLEAYISAVWTEMTPLPTGYIDGLVLSNAADADHDITIATGACRNVQTSNSDDSNMRLTTAITKQIDSNWAVGTGAGGLDGGTVGNDTWYHKFLILNPSDGTVDALFSSSATAPTLPTGYTKSRRIGAVLTDGSANIIAFSQHGDFFEWDVPIFDQNNASMATSETTYALSVPLGVKVLVNINVTLGTNSRAGLFYSPDSTGAQPQIAQSVTGNIVASDGGDASQVSNIPTNLLSQIAGRSSAAITSTMDITTTSWRDYRGKE